MPPVGKQLKAYYVCGDVIKIPQQCHSNMAKPQDKYKGLH